MEYQIYIFIENDVYNNNLDIIINLVFRYHWDLSLLKAAKNSYLKIIQRGTEYILNKDEIEKSKFLYGMFTVLWTNDLDLTGYTDIKPFFI